MRGTSAPSALSTQHQCPAVMVSVCCTSGSQLTSQRQASCPSSTRITAPSAPGSPAKEHTLCLLQPWPSTAAASELHGGGSDLLLLALNRAPLGAPSQGAGVLWVPPLHPISPCCPHVWTQTTFQCCPLPQTPSFQFQTTLPTHPLVSCHLYNGQPGGWGCTSPYWEHWVRLGLLGAGRGAELEVVTPVEQPLELPCSRFPAE